MSYQNYIIDIILIITLIIALITDLKSRKIYDKLTIPVAIIGIIINIIYYGFDGAKSSLIGWVVGVAIFMIFGLGGGDLKLMGAIGALKGWKFTLISFVYIGIAGGFLAIIYLIWTGKLTNTLQNTFKLASKKTRQEQKEEEKTYLPFAPAILLGIVWAYFAINYDFLSLLKL
jgi:prepilin peptidase CpaA